MKKLIGLSILAASLSTAAFATSDVSIGDKNASSQPRQMLASEKAAPSLIEFASIAQQFNNAAPTLQVQKVEFAFDKNSKVTKGNITFFNPLTSKEKEALQVAMLSSVRKANSTAGWTQCIPETGTGSTLVTVNCIEAQQGPSKVHAYVISSERNTVTVKEVEAKKDVVSQLTGNKNKASLKPVVVAA